MLSGGRENQRDERRMSGRMGSGLSEWGEGGGDESERASIERRGRLKADDKCQPIHELPLLLVSVLLNEVETWKASLLTIASLP